MDEAWKAAAREALAAWDAAINGDSGDAELEAGMELADLVAAALKE